MNKWRRKYHREFYHHVIVCAILFLLSFVFVLFSLPGASVLAPVMALAAVIGWVWSIFQAKARLDIFDDD